MTSERLGEMFKGYSADMCAGKFPLVLMGGRANGQACADGERGRQVFAHPLCSFVPFHVLLFIPPGFFSSFPPIRSISFIFLSSQASKYVFSFFMFPFQFRHEFSAPLFIHTSFRNQLPVHVKFSFVTCYISIIHMISS